ncbi:MAG: cytochrome C [Alphaproteobacteria bacterium]|nr:MAG: cytochrome C [Alphaproteobacteria bacterium]
MGSSSVAFAETLLERGTYLMRGIVACGSCHTPPAGPFKGKELAGGFVFDEEPFTTYAANITPDRETGIGAWSDEEIIRAIREGIRPGGGRVIGPPMPIGMYRSLSDRDARAIVAYLRTVPPVRHEVPEAVYRIPLPPRYGPPLGEVPDVPRSDKVAYGEYLARIGHCIECHTPMDRGRRDFSRTGAGGQVFEGPWGVSVAANLTPDSETGLGAWSDAEIKRAISEGISHDGRKLNPPMPFGYFRNISEEDLDALVAYLRSLKPVHNRVQ